MSWAKHGLRWLDGVPLTNKPKKNMIINKHSQTMAVTSLSGSLLMIIMTYVVFHYPVDVCLSFNPDD